MQLSFHFSCFPTHLDPGWCSTRRSSTATPPSLMTTGPTAWIHFHSDFIISDQGFHITYTTSLSNHHSNSKRHTVMEKHGSSSSLVRNVLPDQWRLAQLLLYALQNVTKGQMFSWKRQATERPPFITGIIGISDLLSDLPWLKPQNDTSTHFYSIRCVHPSIFFSCSGNE